MIQNVAAAFQRKYQFGLIYHPETKHWPKWSRWNGSAWVFVTLPDLREMVRLFCRDMVLEGERPPSGVFFQDTIIREVCDAFRVTYIASNIRPLWQSSKGLSK